MRRDAWTISSFCASNECVAVKFSDDKVHVRASGNPEAILTVTREAWAEFIQDVKAS